jgi:hypothetical protein
MNKDLATKLIKIANSLDDIGYFNEANSLTKIAQGFEINYSSIPTGEYPVDIQNYKTIITKFQELKDSNAMDFDINQVARDATNFLNAIKSSQKYTSQQKEIFLLQAKNIRNEIYGKLDGVNLNNKLYNLLNSNEMIDQNQNPTYTLVDFRTKWMQNILPNFDTANPNVAKWLTNKFNLYKTKILNDPNLD